MDFEEWWEDKGSYNTQLKNECENLLRSSNFDDETLSQYEKELWQSF